MNDGSPALATDVARTWLDRALVEARAGAAEGGQPVGAVLFDGHGAVLGLGRNRFVQTGELSAHAETEAFRDAPVLEDYAATAMVTSAEPCWFCAGLIRQFRIGRLVVGASAGFGTMEWLEQNGVEVILLDDEECRRNLQHLLTSGAR